MLHSLLFHTNRSNGSHDLLLEIIIQVKILLIFGFHVFNNVAFFLVSTNPVKNKSKQENKQKRI